MHKTKNIGKEQTNYSSAGRVVKFLSDVQSVGHIFCRTLNCKLTVFRLVKLLIDFFTFSLITINFRLTGLDHLFPLLKRTGSLTNWLLCFKALSFVCIKQVERRILGFAFLPLCSLPRALWHCAVRSLSTVSPETSGQRKKKKGRDKLDTVPWRKWGSDETSKHSTHHLMYQLNKWKHFQQQCRLDYGRCFIIV